MDEFPDIEPIDVLAEIEKDLGLDAAKRLVATYGGQAVSVPDRIEGLNRAGFTGG